MKKRDNIKNFFSICKVYPLTFILITVFSVLSIINIYIESNISTKLVSSLLFSIFVFFAIESRYFNIKFENLKDARSLKLWHYLFGTIITLIMGILIFMQTKYNIHKNADIVNIVLSDSMIFVIYSFVITSVTLTILALIRISKNINLEKVERLDFNYIKYVKLLSLGIVIILINFILKTILINFKLTYFQTVSTSNTIFYILFPILIAPLGFKIITEYSKENKEKYKKLVIYYIIPISILILLGILIYYIINYWQSGYTEVFSSFFLFLSIIAIGINRYIKDTKTEKKTSKKELKIRREDKYLKILSIFVLTGLIGILLLSVGYKIFFSKFDSNITMSDVIIAIMTIYKIVFIYLYLKKDKNLSTNLVNCVNLFIILSIIMLGVYNFLVNILVIAK